MVFDRGKSGAIAFGVAVLFAAGACGASEADAQTRSPLAREEHVLSSEKIREPSGLVQSRRHAGVFWTHNDSGDFARIFAIDRKGAALAEFRVEKARNVDWEEITADDAGHLYIGDIGNNRSTRRDLAVYRIAEPDPAQRRGSVVPDRVLRFRYADQTVGRSPREYDAEAMVWYAGSLYLFTKHRVDACTTVYRLPDEATAEERVLEPLASLRVSAAPLPFSGNVTGASLSADGTRLAVLTYTEVRLFSRSGKAFLPLRAVASLRLEPSRTGQVEGIAWDGTSLLLGNEARRLFRIPDPPGAAQRGAAADPACTPAGAVKGP
jgi:hypothetical protein